MNIYKILGVAALSIGVMSTVSSCKKSYLDTKPSHQVVLDDVFKDVKRASNVINGIHRRLYESNDHDAFGMPSINMTYELMTEDYTMSSTGYGWFVSDCRYQNSIGGDAYQWSVYYQVINNANFVLKYIDQAVGSENDKNEVRGQAYALRAWAYFQLIQTYQFAYGSAQYVVAPSSSTSNFGAIAMGANTSQALGVPIYTEPGKVAKPRSTMKEVLDRMNEDIESSITAFTNTTVQRTDKSQININIAHGLKARMSLYQQRWAIAATEAQLAREGFQLSSGNALLSGFNRITDNEWMWGSLINQEQNGIYASWISHMDPYASPYAYAAQKQCGITLIRYNALEPYSRTIDSTDVRKKWWNPYSGALIDSTLRRRSQLKFKGQSVGSFLGDYPLMRVSEMYLIEAEAKAMANNLSGSAAVLQSYAVTRDPMYVTHLSSVFADKDLLVHEIWRQRRLELWAEGFRLFDAKRQMAIPASSGVVPLASINRSANGVSTGICGTTYGVISADNPRLNFRIPGGELEQNKGCYNNP